MKIMMNQDFDVQVFLDASNHTLLNNDMVISENGTGVVPDGNMGLDVKDPLLSGWPFVIGISMLTLVVGSVLGILLAKKKIKKGFELYED